MITVLPHLVYRWLHLRGATRLLRRAGSRSVAATHRRRTAGTSESRPTWDETWLQHARTAARRSRCSRDQVGAVIVDRDQRIVAVSYNGPPAGWPHDGACSTFCPRAIHGPTDETQVSYIDCPSLHAEANGLGVCDRSLRVGGTIYVTSDVCWSCAKLIANSGLSRVVVARDLEHDHRNAEKSYAFLRLCGIETSIL